MLTLTHHLVDVEVSEEDARAERFSTEPESLGFVKLLKDRSFVEDAEYLLRDISIWAESLIIVGIGGSDLGGRVLQDALAANREPMLDVHFHGDTPDPVALERLIDEVDLTKTVFCIISKSGTTLETMSQYLFFRELFADGDEFSERPWREHFMFITDPETGLLRREAEKYDIRTLAVPQDVGGRFSVLSTVGILPAIAMGIDVKKLLDGAQEYAADETMLALSREIAATQYAALEAGLDRVVMMPYAVQLEEFGRWFRQLWAESLGKSGTGILPIQARGPADQHSQLQFYMEGSPKQVVFFLSILERKEDTRFGNIALDEFSYLSGKSFLEVLHVETDATEQALIQAGRPVMRLDIDHLDEHSLGALFMCFELAVVYLAELMEVNAFDQPGVELSKKLSKKMLAV